ncbi:MAG: hypothetical protein KF764_12490 [Labilithrix sp.]|nr:hypothetical protein [Labilithrix sp.]MBX3223776.1 hypothetical protein [Labilithrix sp.]
MARSDGLRAPLVVSLALTATFIAGCSDLPSKDAALALVKQEITEEATCTLPISLLSRLKMQHSSKAVCVSREGGPPMDEALACLDALAAAGATKRMTGAYMAEWPDEVNGAGFDTVSPYERRARSTLFKGCVEMSDGLREGQFRCGEARADKVVRLTKKDQGQAVVRYSRAITLDPTLGAIDAACGAVTRPAPEGSLTLEKTAEKKWVAASGAEPAPAESSSAH